MYTNSERLNDLSRRYQHIVIISSFTTQGDLANLHKVLNDALNAGLTINKIKEVLVQLYAYCGFPRSLQGVESRSCGTE
jgi:4-carboxymuconolactone decarboxylase